MKRVKETGELRARRKIRRLWQRGDLFHNFSRYPRRPGAPKVDRLAGILKKGLVAPALSEDGSVRSDLHIVVTGSSVPYDSLVFLHRFGDRSYIYTIYEPGRMAVFIDPEIPVLTPKDMGKNWCILCQDEVYVRDRISLESLLGIAVDDADADAVMAERLADFKAAGIPLYTHDGTVIWPKV